AHVRSGRHRALVVGGSVKLAPAVALALALGGAAFLGASQFFDAWDGEVTGRGPPTRGGAWAQVRIEGASGEERRWWRQDVAEGLDLARRPATHKDRFTVQYTVDGQEHATTSAGATSVGFLVALAALAARNMWVAGAPWRFVRPDGPSPSLARPSPPQRSA